MEIIGKEIKVVVDRPLGSTHPKHKNIVYGVNYGYTPDFIGGDGEEQDVYLLGVDFPISETNATVIAVIHRLDDNEDKWVAAPNGTTFTAEQIMETVNFQEKYFKSTLITSKKENL